MTQKINMPVGPTLANLPPKLLPDRRLLQGNWSRLEALSLDKHGADLWDAIHNNDHDGTLWTYLFNEPFKSEAEFRSFVAEKAALQDLWFYAYVREADGKALGMGAFMRAEPANGAIEIGNIWMSPHLQQTRQSTEVIYLMMRHAFVDLKMRRLEWKCDALNAPSRRAALRFGFSFEGIFRQHMVYKGRNRDTAWFAIIDQDWPRLQTAFEAWLAPANFDASGQQKTKLQVG